MRRSALSARASAACSGNACRSRCLSHKAAGGIMMKHRFWIGTYSANGGEGLISATIDEAGRIEIEGAESRIVDASYGLWCADLQTAWFVCEQEAGQVSGWRLENDRWVPLGSVSTGGAAPCFLDISPDHSLLAVANYESGSVATIVLDAATGAPL